MSRFGNAFVRSFLLLALPAWLFQRWLARKIGCPGPLVHRLLQHGSGHARRARMGSHCKNFHALIEC